MNLRNVLRAYSLLRQMSDEELAQLEIWREATDAERALIVETLSDKPQKKAGKKSAGGGGRSKRGAALGDKIRDNLQQRQPTSGGFADDVDMVRCQFTRADGNLCKLLPDHNIHHMTTANEYHEFQSASSTTGKSDAQSAAGGGD